MCLPSWLHFASQGGTHVLYTRQVLKTPFLIFMRSTECVGCGKRLQYLHVLLGDSRLELRTLSQAYTALARVASFIRSTRAPFNNELWIWTRAMPFMVFSFIEFTCLDFFKQSGSAQRKARNDTPPSQGRRPGQFDPDPFVLLVFWSLNAQLTPP